MNTPVATPRRSRSGPAPSVRTDDERPSRAQPLRTVVDGHRLVAVIGVSRNAVRIRAGGPTHTPTTQPGAIRQPTTLPLCSRRPRWWSSRVAADAPVPTACSIVARAHVRMSSTTSSIRPVHCPSVPVVPMVMVPPAPGIWRAKRGNRRRHGCHRLRPEEGGVAPRWRRCERPRPGTAEGGRHVTAFPRGKSRPNRPNGRAHGPSPSSARCPRGWPHGKSVPSPSV